MLNRHSQALFAYFGMSCYSGLRSYFNDICATFSKSLKELFKGRSSLILILLLPAGQLSAKELPFLFKKKRSDIF
jgi:hypothetical protein